MLPGQELAAGIITELATGILALDERLKNWTPRSPRRSPNTPGRRSSSRCLDSVPSWVPSLLVAAGDLRAFPSAGHLAAAAGLVPVPNDSGRRIGQPAPTPALQRPLRQVFYLSAQTSMMRDGPNRDYYLKKRAHGRTTARQSSPWPVAVSTSLGLLRDERTCTAIPPHRLKRLDNTIEIPSAQAQRGRRPRRGGR